MGNTPLSDEDLARWGFCPTGHDDAYVRWLCQWNRRQYIVLRRAVGFSSYGLKYRGIAVVGIETVEQMDDVLAMLQRWGVLAPREL